MPEPRPRSPAQIEASRRNGARSRGPVTPEGKARASRNALIHGLTAMTHLVVDGEDAQELEALTARMMAETGAASEIEARLARRLAIAFWKGERAERIEVAILAAAPRTRPQGNGFYSEAADPLTTFDLRRFNAIRGQQAQLGREISRCLKELRQLRRDALAECTDEPEARHENEPDSPPPAANDDAAILPTSTTVQPARNEPDQPIPPRRAALQQAIRDELLVRAAEPDRDPALLDELMRRLYLDHMGIAASA